MRNYGLQRDLHPIRAVDSLNNQAETSFNKWPAKEKPIHLKGNKGISDSTITRVVLQRFYL